MNRLSPRTLLVGLTAVVGAGALLSSTASAFPAYWTAWMSRYPNSFSDDNVLNGTGSACQLCHQGSGGGNGWNAYGWRVRQFLKSGSSINTALMQSESFDSDTDRTLTINLDEITSDTQPGWTEGPNNTIFFKNGGTLTDQLPPIAIQGDFDPILGDNYCGPAVSNSTGDPGSIAAKGSLVATDNDVTLVATHLPTNQFGYFVTSTTQGFKTNPGGSQGNLCLGGAIGRYASSIANTGTAGALVLVLDLTNTPTAGGPVVVMAGDTWNFQAWFRDQNPGGTSNFTDGLTLTFQ